MGLFSKRKLVEGVNILASYNVRRVFLMIINESEHTIYVSEDPMNVKENGIPIYPFEILVFDRGDGDRVESTFYAYTDKEVEIRIYEGVV